MTSNTYMLVGIISCTREATHPCLLPSYHATHPYVLASYHALGSQHTHACCHHIMHSRGNTPMLVAIISCNTPMLFAIISCTRQTTHPCLLPSYHALGSQHTHDCCYNIMHSRGNTPMLVAIISCNTPMLVAIISCTTPMLVAIISCTRQPTHPCLLPS
jgi:hypothetical protein